MEDREKKQDHHLALNTPLEYLGFGFSLMFIGGGILYCAFGGLRFSSFSVETYFGAALCLYFIMAGPFVLYGIYGLLVGFGAFGGECYSVQQTMIGPAHWIATIALLQWEAARTYFIAFVIALIVLLLGRGIWNHIKQKRG